MCRRPFYSSDRSIMSIPAQHHATLTKIQQALTEPAFKAKCLAFVDQHCDEFLAESQEDENKLEWTQYHKDYQALVEAALEQVLDRDVWETGVPGNVLETKWWGTYSWEGWWGSPH